jgi:hypothetical protein
LPADTRDFLRRYWATHKNPVLVFPPMGNGQIKGPVSISPLSKKGVQGAFLNFSRKTLLGHFLLYLVNFR